MIEIQDNTEKNNLELNWKKVYKIQKIKEFFIFYRAYKKSNSKLFIYLARKAYLKIHESHGGNINQNSQDDCSHFTHVFTQGLRGIYYKLPNSPEEKCQKNNNNLYLKN